MIEQIARNREATLLARPREGDAMTAVVQVFGRRHEEAIHALRRPASEKRQCTKSREYGTRQCSECYGDRMLVAISMVDAARAECFHNFRVLA